MQWLQSSQMFFLPFCSVWKCQEGKKTFKGRRHRSSLERPPGLTGICGSWGKVVGNKTGNICRACIFRGILNTRVRVLIWWTVTSHWRFWSQKISWELRVRRNGLRAVPGRWEKMLLHSVPCYRAPVKKKKGINKAEEVRIEERECKAYFGDRIYMSWWLARI